MQTKTIKIEIVDKKLAKDRSFVRDCFIAGGYIIDPYNVYHLEFVLDAQAAAELTQLFCAKFGLTPKQTMRRGKQVVYFKGGEMVSEVLQIIGATKALLEYEQARVQKSVANHNNRHTNCENANISKVAEASQLHISAIHKIDSIIGLAALPPTLHAVATLRLQNKNLSLTEIGTRLTPPISKSGVNHRLRKILNIAKTIDSAFKRPQF